MRPRLRAAVAIGRCAIIAGVAAIAVVAAATTPSAPPPPAAAAGDCTIDASLDTEEKAFLTLINNHRAANGRAPLRASYMLSRAAAWKSRDMGVNSYFAHDDISRSWVQRIRDCGYGFNTYLGENIAAGISSAQSAFDLWKNSPGHNSNMLGSNYTAIGIGRHYTAGSPYGWYWTTDFGGYDDGFTTIAGIEPPTSIDEPEAPPATIDSAVPPAKSKPVRERPSRHRRGR